MTGRLKVKTKWVSREHLLFRILKLSEQSLGDLCNPINAENHSLLRSFFANTVSELFTNNLLPFELLRFWLVLPIAMLESEQHLHCSKEGSDAVPIWLCLCSSMLLIAA